MFKRWIRLLLSLFAKDEVFIGTVPNEVRFFLANVDNNWEENPNYEFVKKGKELHLSKSIRRGEELKFVALCKPEDRLRVKVALQDSGLEVTGFGDWSPVYEGMRRLWFSIKTLKKEGSGDLAYNVWKMESTDVVFWALLEE